MARTITVKGTGALKAAPDYVVLSMELETKEKLYEKAMEEATARIGRIQSAVEAAGFSREDLKTKAFNVRTDYVNKKNQYGSHDYVFTGYVVTHNLSLAFDFDPGRLAKALSAVTSSDAAPELHISFTVKDPEQISSELLRSAAENALKKAEVLCDALHVKLGQLINISYNWGELDVYSETRYEMPVECMSRDCAAPEFVPDDIDVNDTATFVWEIC